MTQPVPLRVSTDPAHGGRWTSLSGGGREWLWHRDEPRRTQVVPGAPFADAGGLEECVPTVRGEPDHGDAWTRRWHSDGDQDTVECPDFVLSRRILVRDGAVLADYRLAAEPGYRFVWAAHALLDVSTHARLLAEEGTPARLFPEAAAYLDGAWPEGARWVEGPWPAPAGLRLDTFGPGDGSAVGAVLYAPHALFAGVDVLDGPDRLSMSVEADGQPVAVALWRNLRGFPSAEPYRSVGVEPMLGRVFDRAEAADGDCAVTPASGEVRWQLTISASRRSERN